MSAAHTAPGVRIDDRINPILVKEVRQSLRGKYFRVLFWITLGIGTLLGLSIVANLGAAGASETGQFFFMSMFGVLSAAVHCFVPFSAFLSTSSEWDENTYDLLIISNLRPRQIVQGKLLSALIQAVLYYSTFGPFLVFAFLLNGIDLGSVVAILAGSMASCVALTMTGIAASSLATTKVLRVVLMGLFGAGLVVAWGFSIGMAGTITFDPQMLRDAEGQSAVVGYVIAAGLVALVAHSVALSRFAHEEENRSTPLRVVTTLLVLFATAWGSWLALQFGDDDSLWGCHAVVALLLFLPWLFFVTEPEELGRRITAHAPRNRALALLAAPFLPGGGRAVLLCGLQAALAMSTSILALSLDPTRSHDISGVSFQILLAYAYVFAYTALPAGIASFFVRRQSARLLLRIFVAVSVPVSIVLPALLGLFLGIRPWTELEHPLNPFWVILDSGRGTRVLSGQFVLLAGLCLAALINLPRLVNGLREMLRASAARAKRPEAPDATQA